jgi:nucleotide-binding universal stress UspA family protein
MSGKRRKSYEAGHRPKFLAVVDESEECSRAIRFAARRASRTGAGCVLLSIVPPAEFHQWLGVGDRMQEEGEDAAQALLDTHAAQARAIAGIEPELVIRTGVKSDEILKLIMEDEDIAFFVLAASTGAEGPGPLVSALAGKMSGSFPIPIVIVPGGLADDEIDALT